MACMRWQLSRKVGCTQLSCSCTQRSRQSPASLLGCMCVTMPTCSTLHTRGVNNTQVCSCRSRPKEPIAAVSLTLVLAGVLHAFVAVPLQGLAVDARGHAPAIRCHCQAITCTHGSIQHTSSGQHVGMQENACQHISAGRRRFPSDHHWQATSECGVCSCYTLIPLPPGNSGRGLRPTPMQPLGGKGIRTLLLCSSVAML
jgi:hypothetical protein